MSRWRRFAEKRTADALDKAVASTTTPVVAAATRPLTRRVAPYVVSFAVFAIGVGMFLTTLAGGAVSLPLLVVANASLNSDTTITGAGCFSVPEGGAIPDLSTDPDVRAEQLTNATIIVNRGQTHGVPPQGWVVALATAMQECQLRNCDYGDRDSLGVFQQRPSTGWGTPEQVQNVELAADAFYGRATHTDNPGLLDITGWQDMPMWEAAQAVQRSAFPTAYARWENMAAALVASITGDSAGVCQPQSGEWVWPLNPIGEPSSPFGMRMHPVLGVWKLHDGTDWSASCGTPLYAAGAGRVRVEHPAWSGNLVIIEHGGGTETAYGHMQSVTVTPGQTVNAGDQIGTVGTLGYSTGCHLHFMVILNGQPVNPLPWLTQQINTTPEPDLEPGPAPAGGFTVLTYNVHYGRATAATREITQLAADHNPDVICLQEAAGVRQAPAGYRMWRPQVPNHRGQGPTATPLLISTRHTITNQGFVELSGRDYVGPAGAGPDYATPRQIVWATLGNGATVGCTHFTASKDASQARTRLWNQQAAGSVRFLSTPGRLLAGDFNATPDSRWMTGFRKVAVVDSNRARTHVAGGRIDMVWGSGYLPGPARSLPKLGSDHLPVITTWRAQ